MSSIVFRSFSAVIVARTMLIGVRLPMHLERISLMPASSSTARTGPPAITPVPSAAGRRNTSPAPYVPVISCGIVVPITGTLNRFFLASSSALRIASGTSFAFPVPKPTRPFVTDYHKSGEAEATSTFNYFCYTVDCNDACLEFLFTITVSSWSTFHSHNLP